MRTPETAAEMKLDKAADVFRQAPVDLSDILPPRPDFRDSGACLFSSFQCPAFQLYPNPLIPVLTSKANFQQHETFEAPKMAASSDSDPKLR